MSKKAKVKVKAKLKKKAQPIPKGFHTLTPYLIVKGATDALEFYKRALGAKERLRFHGPDGKSIAHAQMTVGNSIFMLGEESPHSMCPSPLSLKGTPVGFVIYTKDADKAFQRAVDAGCKIKQPLEDKFYGDRSGTVEDPFGHNWTLMTHIEDVSKKEMGRRMEEFCAKMAQAQAAA